MNKTQEITKMMHSGYTPTQIIARGYKRGLVYKVNRTLHKNLHNDSNHPKKPTQAILNKDDTDIESDPEIKELKKTLRKAELERKIAEIKIPKDIESRITTLEENTLDIEEFVNSTYLKMLELKEALKATPLYNLRNRFNCGCGDEGMPVVKVECSNCGKAYRYGCK